MDAGHSLVSWTEEEYNLVLKDSHWTQEESLKLLQVAPSLGFDCAGVSRCFSSAKIRQVISLSLSLSLSLSGAYLFCVHLGMSNKVSHSHKLFGGKTSERGG